MDTDTILVRATEYLQVGADFGSRLTIFVILGFLLAITGVLLYVRMKTLDKQAGVE